MTHESETNKCQEVLAPYCQGFCLDIGFGGSAIKPDAITLDMPTPYCPSIEGHRQILRGDCRNLRFICDGAFDSVFSSHLIEDFSYLELRMIITEWRRVLKVGGYLVLNAPDQQKFLAHCAATGQEGNPAHEEVDFSLRTFIKNVIAPSKSTEPWTAILKKEVEPYSWYAVFQKAKA